MKVQWNKVQFELLFSALRNTRQRFVASLLGHGGRGAREKPPNFGTLAPESESPLCNGQIRAGDSKDTEWRGLGKELGKGAR